MPDLPVSPLTGLPQLLALGGRIGRCTELTELLACAAELARATLGFTRSAAFFIRDGALTAAATSALTDPRSDELRRRLLTRPLRLAPSSPEAQILLQPEGTRTDRRSSTGLISTLGLEQFALAAIALESRPLALLVLDRTEPVVVDADLVAIRVLVALVEGGIERLLLRRRLAQLAGELRYLTVSANALIKEALHAPLPFGDEGGRDLPELPMLELTDPIAEDAMRRLLTVREVEVAALLARGRSNREIAQQLMVSPETVKAHVTRIMRKLNASNRAEAVARYLQLLAART